jgi:hypothetical protein
MPKEMAEFFYEQCAGTTSGHMAAIPNNPVLFGLVSACAGKSGSTHACSRPEFAALLREAAAYLEKEAF